MDVMVQYRRRFSDLFRVVVVIQAATTGSQTAGKMALFFGLMKTHWFSLIRPAIKPLFRFGGDTWPFVGGRLTSHDTRIKQSHP